MENKNRGSKISQIVKLKQLIKKWRSFSNTPCAYVSVYSRSPTSSPPPDVPEGYFAVHVGRDEKKRFIIPTTYLSSPQFRSLLDKAEEEFGFSHVGLLTIPCEISVFEQMLHQLEG
ncbi:hypothetical protein KI387_003081, partial [Taxus chinensis]